MVFIKDTIPRVAPTTESSSLSSPGIITGDESSSAAAAEGFTAAAATVAVPSSSEGNAAADSSHFLSLEENKNDHLTTTTTTTEPSSSARNNNNGYDYEMARLLSRLSGWSYSDLDTFKLKIATECDGLSGCKFLYISVVNNAMFIVAHAQMILSHDNKTVYISFRGTDPANFINWLTDTGTRKTDFVGIPVHSGFLLNYQSVWDGDRGIGRHLKIPKMINETFTDYHHSDETIIRNDYATSENEEDVVVLPEHIQNIYLTGHSLGGAMCVLAALGLQQNHPDIWEKVRGVYTFGQPMAFDSNYRDIVQVRIGDKLFRHIYYNDIAPHLPPLSVGDFDHAGDEYKYNPKKQQQRWTLRRGKNKGTLLLRPRATQVPSVLFTGIPAVLDIFFYNVQWLRFIKMPWSFQDHNPYNYIVALDAVVVSSSSIESYTTSNNNNEDNEDIMVRNALAALGQ